MFVGTRAAKCDFRLRCECNLIVRQAYISQLASVPPETFANASVRVVVIGCGEWDVIPFYKGAEERPSTAALRLHLRVDSYAPRHHLETTGFKGDIYADSSRETFRALDLKVNLEITPKGEKNKSYVPQSRFVNVISSTWVSAKNPQELRMPYREDSGRLRIQRISENRETSLSWAENSFLDQVRQARRYNRPSADTPRRNAMFLCSPHATHRRP